MKNKVINLDVPIKDLDGNDIIDNVVGARPTSLGKILANELVRGSKGDPLKFLDWAMRLNKGETVEVDRSDYEKLKQFVLDHETMTILAKGQILPLLENDKVELKTKK